MLKQWRIMIDYFQKIRTKFSLPSTAIMGLLAIVVTLVVLVLTLSQINTQQHYQQKAATPADVVVDFGDRTNHSHTISQTFLGVGGLGLNNVTGVAPPFIAQANLRLSRIDTGFENIFPTQASATNPSLQHWGPLDTALTFFQVNNMIPVVILNYTPTWLQPANNPCSPLGKPLSHVKPTDLQAWGQLAATTVAHIDANYPNLHPLYEFWNEPDGNGFWCEFSTNADLQRLSEYKQLWAAAGPQMRTQAQKDGTTIKMGGPALAYSQVRASIWIPSIVNDPTVAPYIDFISYHHYVEGSTTWQELVNKTQGANTEGHIYLYQDISSYVRSGKQLNPDHTPIYIDEYNANSCNPGQCRNDPAYSPLWNTLFLTDMLNTVIIPTSPNGLAHNSIAGVSYFTWSEPQGQFCMFGVIDSAMDCSKNGTLVPYPQYYAYELFGGVNYLNSTDNGYVANAASSNISGVFTTGFYTNHLDNIVIVNTTTTDFSAMTVFAANPGNVTGTTANSFLLNQANPQISKQPITISSGTNGYTTVIHVPAYSTVAIAVSVSGIVPTSTPTSTLTPKPTLTTTLTNTPVPTQTVTPVPTITPIPTNTPQPTPTVNPQATTITITLCPHGLGNCGDNANPNGGNIHPLHPDRIAHVFIYDLGNNFIKQSDGKIHYSDSSQVFSGTIDIENLAAGQYFLRVSMDGFLRRLIPQVISFSAGQNTVVPAVSLVAGDIYPDNQLDISDYNILINCYGDKQNSSSCSNKQNADLNDDGLVDGGDYNEFLREISVQTGQ